MPLLMIPNRARLLRYVGVYYEAREFMRETIPTTLQQVSGAPAGEPERDADLGFLWDFWYPALRSTEIVGKRLATAMLLEVPLVLGRTSGGQAFAMRDSCHHRGIPLSYGRFE